MKVCARGGLYFNRPISRCTPGPLEPASLRLTLPERRRSSGGFSLKDLLGDNRTPSPAMTKAFLINTASYMTGENAGGNLPGDRQGWGLVDLSRSFDSATRVLVDQTQLFTESGQTFEAQGSVADRTRPLRVTLTWTDAPGSLVGPAIVNDLDLELSVGGVTFYRGNNSRVLLGAGGESAD